MEQISRAAVLYRDSCRSADEHPLSGTFKAVGQWRSYEQLGLLIMKSSTVRFAWKTAELCFSPGALILAK